MNSSASLCIKVLTLAIVVWAVMSTNVLSAQAAGWVPWAAFLLLMLLEAYATDSKPAAWSQWSAGLQRMVGPGMLPYYALLAAFLTVGPGQVRHISPPSMPAFSGAPTGRPGGFPNQYPGGQPTPGRPTGFPGKLRRRALRLSIQLLPKDSPEPMPQVRRLDRLLSQAIPRMAAQPGLRFNPPRV